jgi:hypothetical protein
MCQSRACVVVFSIHCKVKYPIPMPILETDMLLYMALKGVQSIMFLALGLKWLNAIKHQMENIFLKRVVMRKL